MNTTKLRLTCATLAISAAFPALATETNTDIDADVIDKIIVTGTPYEKNESDVLTGVSVLDGDELERNIQASIGETLRKEPGISTTFFGAGASRPIIRGQDGDRVRVLDNGIGSIDASSASPDHAVAVEPAMAESIEIIRGTSVLRFGSSGAGGVVNVIDGRMPSEVPENRVEGAFRVGTTTVDEGTEAAGALTGKLFDLGELSVVGHASFAIRDAEDYDIPGFAESSRLRALEEEEEHEEEEDHDEDEHEEEEEIRDTLENSFVETETYAGGLSFIGERGFFSFGIKQTNTEYGLPGGHEHGHGHHDEEHEDEDEDHDEHGEEEEGVFIDLEQTRFDMNGRFDLGGEFLDAVQFFAGFADYEHTEFEAPGEPGTVFSNEGHELRVELVQRERDGWRGATGIQLRKRDFSAIGEEAFVTPSETKQFGLFTFQEFKNGPWTYEGALRYENTDQENDTLDFSRTFDAYSVSAGAGYDLSETTLVGVTVFRTERAPTSEELFADGPHLATGQFEIGDVTLDKEVATGVEGVFRVESDNLRFAFNAFYTDYSDFIYGLGLGVSGADILMDRGETDEEELEEFEGLAAYQFTSADATFTGFEIAAEAELTQMGAFNIGGDLVLDVVNAEIDVDGNENLPRIPPFGATIGLDAESDMFFFRGEIEYAAEQDDTADFELPTDSYTLVNFYADVTPFESAPGLSLSAAMLNATDEEARIHSSFLKDEVPLPGRNYRFSVKYSF